MRPIIEKNQAPMTPITQIKENAQECKRRIKTDLWVIERSTGGPRTLTFLSLYIRYKSTGIFRPSIEESSGESSTKTKSWRSRPATPQRKRNRRGVVRRVLNENEIVEESRDESSMSME